VDDDWNYVGNNKMIMEELKDLPEEAPIELPMTPQQHNTIDAVYVRPEITIKAENPVYLPMKLSRETELSDEFKVTIKTENSSSLATPADSLYTLQQRMRLTTRQWMKRCRKMVEMVQALKAP
jgi:hypothetical protein